MTPQDRNLRRRAVWPALVAAVFLSACGRSPSLYAELPASQAPLASIVVVQPDAIVVDGQHIHLVDMAAPQAAPHAHCVAEAAAARQTRLRLIALSEDVHAVEVTPTGARDGHGRIEAHVRFDGQDPAAILIDEGLAVAAGAKATSWCAPISQSVGDAMHIAMLSMASR